MNDLNKNTSLRQMKSPFVSINVKGIISSDFNLITNEKLNDTKLKILLKLEKSEKEGIKEWENAIKENIEEIEKIEVNKLYIYSPADILIHNIISSLIKSRGTAFFIGILKNNIQLAELILKYSRTLYLFRDVTKILIQEMAIDTIQYLFAINPNNKYYDNTFAEIIIHEGIGLMRKKRSTYENETLIYSELNPSLLEHFLRFSELYLTGIQKARFDVYCLYYFEIARRETSCESAYNF